MLKKIEKNQENKFVINAILPLKTFLDFEKNTKVWSKIPYVTTERFSWKKHKTENLLKRFCVRERLYVLKEKRGTRAECP